MRSLAILSLRDMRQHALRTALSTLAVALGVTMVVAADVTGKAVTGYGERMDARQSTAGILGALLEQWLGLVGLALLGVAAFLVFNAFLMSVTSRRRQIGLLRSLGMTRHQVTRSVLTEGLLVGVAGTLCGLIVGPLAGRGLVALLGELAGIAYVESLPSLGYVLLAAALGVGVACLSALLPARRAMSVPPLEALHPTAGTRAERRPSPSLHRIGLITAALLAAGLLVAPPAARIPPPETSGMPWHAILTAVCSLIWLTSLVLVLPALIGGLGRWLRAPLGLLCGTAGCLMADNLRRDRGRVMLTVVALAVAGTVVVAITAALTLLSQSMLTYYTGKQIPPRWALFPIAWTGELASWQTVSELDLSAFGVSKELYTDVLDRLGPRAQVLGVRAAIIPELDVVPGSMSFLLDTERMRRMALFDFYEGDWESAAPALEKGCGVLITPGLARRHGVWLGDTMSVPGRQGPVSCTVAGLGLSANFGASLIGATAADQFNVPDKPFGLFLQPHPGVDAVQFEDELRDFAAAREGIYVMDLRDADEFQETMVDGLLAILNGPLLLAIAAAALGVINTTAMSVAERRHELGLLRAVGATRRQVRRVVMGEAALMGLLGGLLGLLTGGGLAAILVLAGDHSAWGVREAALRPLLRTVVRAAVLNGLAGTLIAPLICALAAWIPLRALLRGSAVDAMRVE